VKDRAPPFQTPDPAFVSEALAAAGFHYQTSLLKIELHEEKWLVRLPGQRMAWFAASRRGLEQLDVERRVLRLLEARCSFAAPRLLFESLDGEFDVRTMVPGSADPLASYHLVRDSTEHAVRIGAEIGTILAEQHSKITVTDVSPWLPRQPSWPEPREWVRERLPRVVDNAGLISRADAVMAAYDQVAVDEADLVLVHTDVGFHNLAIDPESHAVNGIFDYEGAAWADRHHDFRYLVFAFDRYELFEAASSAYEAVVGRPIHRDRVFLYNAACAITFLAFRVGIEAEECWCGRTLAEDLQWSQHAIAKVLDA
jgi:aminoglycoside phosphotransferase (APT) family kinase protein